MIAIDIDNLSTYYSYNSSNSRILIWIAYLIIDMLVHYKTYNCKKGSDIFLVKILLIPVDTMISIRAANAISKSGMVFL